MRRLAHLVALLLAVAACDSVTPPVEPPVEPPGEPVPAVAPLRSYTDKASFRNGRNPAVDHPFGVSIPARGNPFGVSLSVGGEVSATNEKGALFGSFFSGLWLGGRQDGAARANVVWYGRSGSYPTYGNFTSACGGSAGRLFALSADTVYTDTEAWPRALGAPTNDDGSPRVYGDRMLWGSSCPAAASDIPRFSSPFRDIRVNTAVYGYDDLPGMRFVRYEVTNTSTAPISELRVGYFSDTDSPSAGSDAVGFDVLSGLSYVYNLAKSNTGQYRTSWVSGFAFLETPKNVPLLAHRIMRKNNYYNPEFGETGVETAEQLIYALDGLTNDGDPATDPKGTPTRFAFTGDPFAGTGWRDGLFGDNNSYQGVDIRHITSVGPIDLAPGETAVFTVVWVTAVEASPGVSHFAVTQTLATVRATPSRWRF